MGTKVEEWTESACGGRGSEGPDNGDRRVSIDQYNLECKGA